MITLVYFRSPAAAATLLPYPQPNAIYKDLQINHQDECYCHYYLVSSDYFLQPRHDAGFSPGTIKASSTSPTFFASISQRGARFPNY